MSCHQSHSLCSKFKKWMSSSYLLNKNTNNCSMNHNLGKKLLEQGMIKFQSKNVFYSPYKRTNFPTLLRNYPKVEEQFRNSRAMKDNESNNPFKRSFQNRASKYDHVKSRINTNLNAKIAFQNQNIDCGPLSYKRVKMNQDQIPLENKRLLVKILNDENDPSFMNRNPQYAEQPDLKQIINCKKVDLNKKIKITANILQGLDTYSGSMTISQREKQTAYSGNISSIDEHIDESSKNRAQNMVYYLRSSLKKASGKYEQHQKYQSLNKQTLKYALDNSPCVIFQVKNKFVFDQISLNREKQSQIESLHDQFQQDIFSIEQYRILQEERQSEDIKQIEQSLQIKELMEIEELQLIEELQDSEQLSQQIQNDKDSKVEDLQKFQIQQGQFKRQKQEQQDFKLQHKFDVKKSLENQNHKKICEGVYNTEKTKIKQIKQRKKQQNKILTRSKEQRLHLYNKISLRLLRKKYGNELSHEELADKILQNEAKIQLKAFISHNDEQNKQTIFDSTDLSYDQKKNILIKYLQEEDCLSLSKK